MTRSEIDRAPPSLLEWTSSFAAARRERSPARRGDSFGSWRRPIPVDGPKVQLAAVARQR